MGVYAETLILTKKIYKWNYMYQVSQAHFHYYFRVTWRSINHYNFTIKPRQQSENDSLNYAMNKPKILVFFSGCEKNDS